MDKFRRRFYTNPADFFRDVSALLRRRKQIKKAMSGETISAAFRERLMMVVTEVNGCRYCRSFHVPQAVSCGVSEEEINEILAGQLPVDAPEDELAALAYAQHWAEESARPDPVYRQQVLACYGEETFAGVETILRMIRLGNLAGNTLDYVLYRLSFGRWGGQPGGEHSSHQSD